MDRITRDWISFKRSRWAGLPPDPYVWADEALEAIVTRDPSAALAIVLRILSTDCSLLVVAALAAGPLEELLVHHGPTVIDEVEAAARTNPQVVLMLTGVWPNAIPGPVALRLRRLLEQHASAGDAGDRVRFFRSTGEDAEAKSSRRR